MSAGKNIFFYGKDSLTVGAALRIVQGESKAVLDGDTKQRVKRSRKYVRKMVENKDTVYGITTGFGPLCTTNISPEETQKLQHNILKSHSVGVGESIPDSIVRLMLILKIHALSKGFSGISPSTLERMIHLFEQNIVPVVPAQGSVGASGDLAPLAHLFLPLIGLGRVRFQGKEKSAGDVLRKLNLKPLELGPKEGLALINGTQFMTAFAASGLARFLNCLDNADIVGAMSLDALMGSVQPFNAALQNLRPYTGGRHAAHRIRSLLTGSEINVSHRDCGRVQDPYSLRCMSHVHGASRNAWLHLKETLHVEMNAVTDNPVILEDGSAVSGGNFHGQPLALPLDYASLASSELGNISDRRTYLMLKGDSCGLPRLLVDHSGINSGFMILQYTSAALASENKSLCFPPSADSIPTSLGQEDHVSMGAVSGRRLHDILQNLENILAVELLAATQALDFRKPLKTGKILNDCYKRVREKIDHLDEDRLLERDLKEARKLITSGELVRISADTAKKHGLNLAGDDGPLFILD
ncbi:MAG: histidine ammonia-lyase [Candidatus Aminicenantes bacterium]|nr:histidine ammonia-lyase [Candidatus Aminicenantes bacterium]